MIGPDETEIVGEWIVYEGEVQGDESCQRIHTLTKCYLEKLGSDQTGWETLYRDPGDGRLWERSYPQSEMHGGGPPTLRIVDREQIATKYPNVFGEA